MGSINFYRSSRLAIIAGAFESSSPSPSSSFHNLRSEQPSEPATGSGRPRPSPARRIGFRPGRNRFAACAPCPLHAVAGPILLIWKFLADREGKFHESDPSPLRATTARQLSDSTSPSIFAFPDPRPAQSGRINSTYTAIIGRDDPGCCALTRRNPWRVWRCVFYSLVAAGRLDSLSQLQFFFHFCVFLSISSV